ncbi:unnamed protein product [Cochlearia groenlandica]
MVSLRQHLTKQISRLLKRRNKLESLNETKKKLHLVLDLDHTLIHTVSVSQLSKKEKYLLQEVDSRLDLWTVFDKGQEPNDVEMIIKLRPFLREFLQEANKLFYLHVYTMGSRDYAETVLSLIDPDKTYFGDRVVTREASPLIKTLDLVVADKRRAVIVDDTRQVWFHDHKRNLLEISKYIYFREEDYFNVRKSLAEKKRDESGSKGALVKVLKYLKNLHRRFGQDLDSKDLRLLLLDPKRPCCF